MPDADRAKKGKPTNTTSSTCCGCCGGAKTAKKKGSNYDVTGAGDDDKEGNEDDASHIASLKNRNQSAGSTYNIEADGTGGGTSKWKSSILKNHKRISRMSKQLENSNLISNSRSKSKKGCKTCCIKFTAFILSHIGLSIVVVGYAVMGAFLFQSLEAGSEKQVRTDMKHVRDEFIQKLWVVTKEFNVLHEGNWTINADVIIRQFQDEVYSAIKDKGWDGREAEASEVQWSFPGALLYSITVITTIGYGNLAPKTDYGRLATIFYALVGIPITLLFLANIGGLFGHCFRFLYKHFCIGLVWLCCPSHYQQSKPSASRSKTDGIQSGQTTPILIVRGDTAQRDKTSIFNEKDTIQTLQRKAVSWANLKDAGEEHKPMGNRSGTSVSVDENQSNIVQTLVAVRSDDWSERPEKRKKKKLKDEVRVPIFVSLLIITLYIFGGACMFSMWQKDWDYLIGSYFCFITLSTIGFGDFVFGTGADFNDNTKLIACALYMVFGLAIIAMTFDLMQEEVRAKFRWLGTKLGLMNEDDS